MIDGAAYSGGRRPKASKGGNRAWWAGLVRQALWGFDGRQVRQHVCEATATQYQSGIDFHFDWGVSQFLSKQVFVGFVGYAYQQTTDDFSQPAGLGGFRSRVLG